MNLSRLSGLRARLVLSTLFGSVLAVGALVSTFNLVLDSKLRSDVDDLLRARASAQLRTVVVLDGRLRVPEAPDKRAADAQAWIFAGLVTLERPALPTASDQAALALRSGGSRFVTVDTTDTRLHAVPIAQGSQRLGTLVVGASLSSYESSARATLIGSIILGILTVLGIVAVSAWVIRRALAPVATMTAAAASWTEHDLSRRFFVGEPHDELTELAATFDRLLERLSQSLKREQRFTAEVSHELRTPLAKILAEAELAAAGHLPASEQPDGEPDAERYRRALASIRSSAESLRRALEALLATARAQSSDDARSSDANRGATRAVEQARAAASRPAVVVELQRTRPGVRVAAEPELLERALAPLLENAIRFARRRVEVAILTVADRVLFEIHDDGPGVAAANRERIFEPGIGEQVGGADDGDGAGLGGASGAGLGLPLARRLAHAAGGEIEHLPTPEGASFVLRLPAA